MHREHVTIIEAEDDGLGSEWREVWDYRELGWMLAVRDVSVRYKQAVLGAAWAVFQPLTNMLVFTFLLGRIARMPSDGIPYPIFVFAGLLPWFLFANSVTQAGMSVVGAANLVQKVYFPRLLIPLSAIGAYLLDFAISLLLMFVMMAWYGVWPGPGALLLPVLLLGVMMAAAGVGILLAALNVAYRDFRFVIGLMVQIWMLVTPIVYPASAVSEQWRWLIFLNPVAGYVTAFRGALLGTPIEPWALAYSFAASAFVLAFGLRYFRRVERGFADMV